MKICTSATLALALLAVAVAGHAGEWLEEDLLSTAVRSSDGVVDFGAAMAVDRNPDGSVRALYVGLPDADVVYGGLTYQNTGKVEVWRPEGGWHLALTIDGHQNTDARFGAAIAVHRGAIAIGAPGTNGGTGRVWLYEDRNSQLPGEPPLDIQLAPGDFAGVSVGDKLGWSVAIHGDGLKPGGDGSFLVVGAPTRNANSGCVYVQKVRRDISNPVRSSYCPNTAQANAGFSVAVRASGPDAFTAVVGAPSQTRDGVVAGSARLLFGTSTSLSQSQLLNVAEPKVLDAYGYSVAIDAARIYVGGPSRTRGDNLRSGSVAVFLKAAVVWNLEAELFPAADAGPDLCGWSVAADVHPGNTGRVVIGCPEYNGDYAHQGSLRVFERLAGSSSWGEEHLVVDYDSLDGPSRLGKSVALAGDRAFGGGPEALAPLSTDVVGEVRVFLRDRIFRDGFE